MKFISDVGVDLNTHECPNGPSSSPAQIPASSRPRVPPRPPPPCSIGPQYRAARPARRHVCSPSSSPPSISPATASPRPPAPCAPAQPQAATAQQVRNAQHQPMILIMASCPMVCPALFPRCVLLIGTASLVLAPPHASHNYRLRAHRHEIFPQGCPRRRPLPHPLHRP